MDHASFCPPGLPCRYSWWNIPVSLRIVFFVIIFASAALMIWGIVRRAQLWRRGKPDFGLDRPVERLLRTLKYGVAQVRILRQRYPGVLHFAMFWAIVLLFIGTILGSADTDIWELILKQKLLYGTFYVVYKVVLDLAALSFLIGLGMALWRRYLVRPARLNIDWRFNVTLPLLGFIILSGLFIGALRLAAQNPPWGPAQVVAYPLSFLFRGASEQSLLLAHRVVWIFHFAAVGAAFAILPHTNLFHIFTSPANIFVAPFRNKGALWPVKDLEQADRLGAARLTDFPQPQLVNFDACTECGRCQDVCPAYAAGQPLNPKYVILALRDHMTDERQQWPQDGGRHHQAGDAVVVHHLPPLCLRVPRADRARRCDRRHAALPGPDGGRHSVERCHDPDEHRAVGQPVEAAEAQARGLDPGAGL